MRFFVVGLVIALVVFLATGGHLLFLPLLFVLPLGDCWATIAATATSGIGRGPVVTARLPFTVQTPRTSHES